MLVHSNTLDCIGGALDVGSSLMDRKVSKIKGELLSKEPSFIIMEEKNPHHYWDFYTGYLRPCSATQIRLGLLDK